MGRPVDGRTVYIKPAGQFLSSMPRQRHAAAMTADRSIPADCIYIHLLQQTREPLDKILPVRAIFEYRFAFGPSNDNSMQGAGASMRGRWKYCIFNRLSTSKQRPYVPKINTVRSYRATIEKFIQEFRDAALIKSSRNTSPHP